MFSLLYAFLILHLLAFNAGCIPTPILTNTGVSLVHAPDLSNGICDVASNAPEHLYSCSGGSAFTPQKRQAGLSVGPLYIGNLKVSLTNPHFGWAGPAYPGIIHVNLHVDKEGPPPKKAYVPVFNLHIVYDNSTPDHPCLYIYDSVTKTVLIHSCFNDFSDLQAAAQAAVSTGDFLKELLDAADLTASVVIVAALAAAVVVAMGSLAAVAVA